MLLRIGYAWAQVTGATPREQSFIQDYLTFTSVAFSGTEQRDTLLGPQGHFPAGLAPVLIRALRAREMHLEVVQRASPEVFKGAPDLGYLWPHQRAAMDVVLGGKHRGVIQHATGSGKGTLISALAGILTCRTLIVVPSKQLLLEMHARILKVAGMVSGRVGSGYRNLKPRVVVCIAASLKVLTKLQLQSFGAILIDEVHGAAAKSLYAPLIQCLNASVRLGFSGTPMDRADKKSLYIVGLLGELIHTFSPVKAAQAGIVAKCNLRMVPFEHKVHSTSGLYHQWEARAYAHNKARNLLCIRLIQRSPSPRIVFVRTKDHQRVLAKLLGVGCLTVNDETPLAEIQVRIKAFASGAVSTLVSTPIFRQGVDIPEIMTVINMAGGKAVVDVIQKVGRGSRRHQKDGSTKDEFWVFDIEDRGCGCRGHHTSCKWLDGHARERAQAYIRYGYVLLPNE